MNHGTGVENSFWIDFQIRLKKNVTQISEKVANMDSLIDDTIQDFEFNSDVNRTMCLLKQLQEEIEILFDNLPVETLNLDEMNSLTNICRRFNEERVIQEVRDLHLEEKLFQESNVIIPDSLDKGKISTFVENNFPFGPTKTARSVRSESIAAKKGEHSLSSEEENFITQSRPQQDVKIRKVQALYVESETIKEAIIETSPLENISNEAGNQGTIKFQQKTKSEELLVQTTTTFINQTEVENSKVQQKELDELIELMKEEIKEHRIDEAYRCCLKLKSFSERDNLSKETTDYYEEKIKMNETLIHDIEAYKKDCDQILRELEDEEGYIVEGVKKNFTIKYKAASGQQVSLKMEGIIDIPIFNMIALIYEMQGYTSWMPFCRDAKELKHISRASKAGYIKFSIPPPIFDREAYVYGVGFDRIKENGSMLIVSKSIHDDKDLCKMFDLTIPDQSKTTRLDLDYMGGAFYPLGENKIKISIVVKMDMKIKFLPLSLINWVVRKAAQFLLDRIVKKASNLKGTFWEKQIQENREFYGWLEGKINAYLKEQSIEDVQKS